MNELIPLDKIKKYISYYNKIKHHEFDSYLYTNPKSETSFAIYESNKEVIFAFFISKKSYNFIKEYNKYKENIKIKDEREKSAITFDKTVSELKSNVFLNYCKNKKLNNPFRNFKITKHILDCPNKFDRYCYYDFFFHKIKYYLHTGFMELYNTIAPELLKQVEYYLNHTNKKIVFIGFSFSSVIAQIAYLVYFLKYPTKLHRIETYLFSTPNIGNKKYEKFFETLYQKSKNRRLFIVNCDDDASYNMFSKRFGFYFMKSVLLIKRDKDKKKIYTSQEYEYIINQL